jgi:tetratricopeptide (TPR) repeat protein
MQFGPVRIYLFQFVLILGLNHGAVCLAATQAQTPRQNSNQLNEGIKLLADGKFLEAVAAFNLFKQSSPQDSRPYFYAGIALTEAGRLPAAALELKEALRIDPQRLEYLIFQANVFARLKQKADAFEALSVFEIGDNPDRNLRRLETAWLWLLNDVYYRLGQYENQLKVLALLGERTPNDDRLEFNRGQIHAARRDFDRALESFRKSVASSPDHAPAHFELGKLLHQRGEMSESKKELLQALKGDANNPDYQYRLGAVCLALNELEEAMKYLNLAASNSNLPEVYYSLGNLYQRKGDRTRSAEYRKKFQELTEAQRKKEDREREASILLVDGEKLLNQGQQAEAQALFEQASGLDPNNWTARAYLAEMLLLSGDWQRAAPYLARMEQLDPDSVVGNYLMAQQWFLRKEYEKARDYAEKVKQSRPAHAELRNLLGNIYLSLGRLENAKREYEEAVRLAPERGDFRDNLRRVEKQ